jgi:hypothetical protein
LAKHWQILDTLVEFTLENKIKFPIFLSQKFLGKKKTLAKHWKILDRLVEFTLLKNNFPIFFVTKIFRKKKNTEISGKTLENFRKISGIYKWKKKTPIFFSLQNCLEKKKKKKKKKNHCQNPVANCRWLKFIECLPTDDDDDDDAPLVWCQDIKTWMARSCWGLVLLLHIWLGTYLSISDKTRYLSSMT